MKQVEYWDWWIDGERRRKGTPYPMTAEDAARRYPGAIRIEHTRIVREIPETEQEIMEARFPRRHPDGPPPR